MIESGMIEQMGHKEGVDCVVEQVIENPEHIQELVHIIETRKGTIRYAAEKVLRLTSERQPALVYPHFDFFADLLDSENSFLKWGAIVTLSNLAAVDSANKFAQIFDKYYSLVCGPNMVSAANVVGNSWKIAQAKPDLSDAIVDEVLKLETAEFMHKGELSPECRIIVAGHAIDSFARFFDLITDKKKVIAFVQRQLKSPRPAVGKRAAKFLKRFPG
ncbi:MAG: hypothetical protein JW759_03715 [Candidatus Coatesbacteria bacterium]|nr:hypothetical protein [Candidatus Coatesbacteria bacterium]